MITKEITLYRFDELSEESQKRVIERERERASEIESETINMDYRSTLSKFMTFANIWRANWSVNPSNFEFSYGYNSEEIYVNMLTGDYIGQDKVTGEIAIQIREEQLDRSDYKKKVHKAFKRESKILQSD